MKACNTCGLAKPFNEYTRSSQNKGGYTHLCKACEKDYRQSYKGKLVVMYKAQRSNSKARGHAPPDYSFEQFQMWAEKYGYSDLYSRWHSQGLQRRDAPSADRLDDSKPYTLSNLRLITWGENDDKGHTDFKSGKLYNKHKPVKQINPLDQSARVFVSQSEAARLTGISQGNIGMVCRQERRLAGGYIWEFV